MPEQIQNIPLGLLAAVASPYGAPLMMAPQTVSPGDLAARPNASSRSAPPRSGQGLFAGLFNNNPPSGYTPEDVQKILSNQAEYWQRFPITPQWNSGKGAGGILPGVANFGSGYMATSIPAQQQARAMENERIRSEAANRALDAPSLEDMVRAFQGGTPAQQEAASGIMLRQRLDEYQRRLAMQQFEELQARRRAGQQPQEQPQPEPSAGVPAPTPAASPLPVTPRMVNTLPLTETGEAMMGGPSQVGGEPTPPPPAPAPSGPADTFLPPEMRGGGTLPGRNSFDFMLPPEMRSAGAPAPAPASAPPPAPPGGPQVRGWVGGEEQPDFVGTPLARGVAPPGAASPVPQAPPVRPSLPQPAQISQPQAPQSLQLDEATIMDMVRSKLITPQEGQLWMQTVRKNPGEIIQERAAQKRGEALGEAQAGLPQSINAAQSTIQKIDEIAANPQLQRIIGYSPYNPLGYLPYTPEQRGLLNRIKQVQGRFFLQAFDALRGGGQITEKEGEKAQEAISRIMDVHQDYRSYRTALEDARREVWNLTNVARVRAGLPAVPYQPAPPSVGAIQDGYRFNGGNPADPRSWQRVQ